jgi:hypothetical protein
MQCQIRGVLKRLVTHITLQFSSYGVLLSMGLEAVRLSEAQTANLAHKRTLTCKNNTNKNSMSTFISHDLKEMFEHSFT